MAKGEASFESEMVEDNQRDSFDWSYVHWGYLNCAQLKDTGRKVKDAKWQTFWAELSGPTLRLYKDLSIQDKYANTTPPSNMIGPAHHNQQKHSFFGLKMGEMTVFDYERQINARGMQRDSTVPRRHVLKLSIPGPSEFLFQCPSKPSLYRWIQKMQSAVDNADKLQSLDEKTLEEAKSLMAESMVFTEGLTEHKDSFSSADTSTDSDDQPKSQHSIKLLMLKKKLAARKALLDMIEQEEMLFTGVDRGQDTPPPEPDTQDPDPVPESVCSEAFEGTLLQDYWLVPGYSYSRLTKGQKVTILGQLPNKRWKCSATVETPEGKYCSTCGKVFEKAMENEHMDFCTCEESEKEDCSFPNLTTHIGSVPSSVIAELQSNNDNDTLGVVTPLSATPPETNCLEMADSSRLPSVSTETPEPYSPHRVPSRLRLIEEEKARANSLALVDFSFPSPPLTPPSSPSECTSMRSSLMSIDRSSVATSEPELDSVSVSGISLEEGNEPDNLWAGVKRRGPYSSHRRNIEIKGKLKARGISMVIGSSSSEGEDEPESPTVPSNVNFPNIPKGLSRTLPGHLTQSMVQEEFKKFKEEEDNSVENYVLPPMNQRRLLQLVKTDSTGFGFSLQTFGIVQDKNDIEYVTFIRSVEAEGPAYLAGVKQGDAIVEIDGENVEEWDHYEIVEKIKNAENNKVRMVVKFVHALRRMELNTHLKKKTVRLKSIEKQLSELENLENKLITGEPLEQQDVEKIADLHNKRSPRIAPLQTIVRTSTFSSRTPHVREDTRQYKHTRYDGITKQTAYLDNNTSSGYDLLKLFEVKDEKYHPRKLSGSGVVDERKLGRKEMKVKTRPPSFVSYVQECASYTSSERSSVSSLSSTAGSDCPFPPPSPGPGRDRLSSMDQPSSRIMHRPWSLQHTGNANFASSRRAYGSAGNLQEDSRNQERRTSRSRSAENLDSSLLAMFSLPIWDSVNPAAIEPTQEERRPDRRHLRSFSRPDSYHQAMGNMEPVLSHGAFSTLSTTHEDADPNNERLTTV